MSDAGPTVGSYPPPCLEGTRVRWRTSTAEGDGIFTLCWLGVEEVWDVRLDDGTTKHIYPCLDDTMEPMAGAQVDDGE